MTESSVRFYQLLLWVAFLLTECRLEPSPDCSEEKNVTCDEMGNGVLNTTALYDHKDCEWSFREKDGTNREELKPSQNITVSCSLSEYRLNVHCIQPKLVSLVCFSMVNKTKQTDKINNPVAATHRTHKFLSIPFVFFLAVMVALCAKCFFKKTKTKKSITSKVTSRMDEV